MCICACFWNARERAEMKTTGDYLHSLAFWPPSHLINYVRRPAFGVHTAQGGDPTLVAELSAHLRWRRGLVLECLRLSRRSKARGCGAYALWSCARRRPRDPSFCGLQQVLRCGIAKLVRKQDGEIFCLERLFSRLGPAAE